MTWTCRTSIEEIPLQSEWTPAIYIQCYVGCRHWPAAIPPLPRLWLPKSVGVWNMVLSSNSSLMNKRIWIAFVSAEGYIQDHIHDQLTKGGNPCNGRIRKLSRQASTLKGIKKESDRGPYLCQWPLSLSSLSPSRELPRLLQREWVSLL